MTVKARTCPCGNAATNQKGPPRCDPCRIERVRQTQLRYRDKSRGSVQRGLDEPRCIWCGVDNEPRSYYVLALKKFHSRQCRDEFWMEQARARTKRARRCPCGAESTNRTGRPLCDACREQNRRDRVRHHTLQVYGLTITDYLRLLGEQKGCCAICGSTEPGYGRTVFAVDHCHASGQTRSLLCYSCNTAIALLREDPVIAEAAAKYIRRTRQLNFRLVN